MIFRHHACVPSLVAALGPRLVRTPYAFRTSVATQGTRPTRLFFVRMYGSGQIPSSEQKQCQVKLMNTPELHVPLHRTRGFVFSVIAAIDLTIVGVLAWLLWRVMHR